MTGPEPELLAVSGEADATQLTETSVASEHGAQTARPERIRLAALRLLQRREYSRCELVRRLSRRHHAGMEDGSGAGAASAADTAIVAVLDELQASGLQSDQRFTESLIRSRAGRGYGPLWIRAELQQRGVASALVETAFLQCDQDWQQVLQALYRRRYGGRDATTVQEFQKRKRFLLNRGFSAELVHRMCRDSDRNDGSS